MKDKLENQTRANSCFGTIPVLSALELVTSRRASSGAHRPLDHCHHPSSSAKITMKRMAHGIIGRQNIILATLLFRCTSTSWCAYSWCMRMLLMFSCMLQTAQQKWADCCVWFLGRSVLLSPSPPECHCLVTLRSSSHIYTETHTDQHPYTQTHTHKASFWRPTRGTSCMWKYTFGMVYFLHSAKAECMFLFAHSDWASLFLQWVRWAWFSWFLSAMPEQMHRRLIFTWIPSSPLLIALWLSATGMVMLTLFAAASRLSWAAALREILCCFFVFVEYFYLESVLYFVTPWRSPNSRCASLRWNSIICVDIHWCPTAAYSCECARCLFMLMCDLRTKYTRGLYDKHIREPLDGWHRRLDYTAVRSHQ